jgi:hypothetical protein
MLDPLYRRVFTERAIKENWCALALCILTDRIPEEALCYIRTGADDEHLQYHNPDVAEQGVQEMINMHAAGIKYREIGAIFGIKAQSVCSRIGKYKRKIKAEGE